MNIVTLLEMAAEVFPDRIAASDGTRRLSYAELLQAAQAAGAAIRDSGAEHVSLLDIGSLAAPVALFGAAYAQRPYAPLNYRLTGSEIAALIERVKPVYLVAPADYAGGCPHVEPADFLALDPPPEPLASGEEPRDVAVQLFTSGTTGQPKAAILRHGNLTAYILGTVEFGAAEEDEATLVAVPPYHIAGISALLSSTYAARRMVLLGNFEPSRWLELAAAERVTNAFLVPTMLARIVEHLDAQRSRPNLPALRAIAYGGGKMPLSVMERAMALFPKVDFTNAYGLTETSSTIALLDPDDHRAAAASTDPAIRRRLGSVGKPLATVELEIRDEEGRALPPGKPGFVFVRGEQVSGEYLGQGSQLDGAGWFPTRDRGLLDEGGYLFLDGRADDVIVRGGENISPGEIEDTLIAHPAVAEAAVVAVPDEEWGEGVGAAIVLKPGATVTTGELQLWVRARLRSSRVPTMIRFRKTLPYNELGKLLRRVVRQDFA
jgi:acyl-CoA synthetase (AMP-forming)/AMP-acid ligase II